MAPFLNREELERTGKEMEEQARKRIASLPPEDPTPRSPYPTLKEGMAEEAKKSEEQARKRRASQPPENQAYERILAQFGELDSQSKLRLHEELAALIRQQVGQPPKHSILELQGLGKEVWQGVDAQEYVYDERSSWEDQTPKI